MLKRDSIQNQTLQTKNNQESMSANLTIGVLRLLSVVDS